MSAPTVTPSSVDAPTQAPFDPRHAAREIPPPPQPSSWLDPIFVHEPGGPVEGGSDDEPLVIVDEESPPVEDDDDEEDEEDGGMLITETPV